MTVGAASPAAVTSRIPSGVTARKSPSTTSTFDGRSRRSELARSRSISNATTRVAAAARSRVIAPRPGPISKNVWSRSGAIARTTFSAHARSRKCWPKRFLAGPWLRPRSLLIVGMPVLVLDRFDFLFAQAEVVTNLMNQRFADRDDQVVFVLRLAFVRTLEKDDAIGE